MNEYWQTFFDTDRERIGTGSSKWDNLGKLFDNPDAIPMWVADMDFPTAPAVTEALVKRAQHGLFGYNVAPATAKQAVCDWMQRRHGAHIEPDWIFSSPGVVDSIFHTLCALTGPDDPVLIQQPVYGPFRAMTVKSERPLVNSNLIETENGFVMDYDDLEQKCASGVTAMLPTREGILGFLAGDHLWLLRGRMGRQLGVKIRIRLRRAVLPSNHLAHHIRRNSEEFRGCQPHVQVVAADAVLHQ